MKGLLLCDKMCDVPIRDKINFRKESGGTTTTTTTLFLTMTTLLTLFQLEGGGTQKTFWLTPSPAPHNHRYYEYYDEYYIEYCES